MNKPSKNKYFTLPEFCFQQSTSGFASEITFSKLIPFTRVIEYFVLSKMRKLSLGQRRRRIGMIECEKKCRDRQTFSILSQK